MKRLAVAVSLLLALIAPPAQAQDQEVAKRGFVWDDRPSFVFGEDISVDLTGRALLEWRKFDPAIAETLFNLRDHAHRVEG